MTRSRSTEPAGTKVTYSWQRIKDGVVTNLPATTDYYRLHAADAGAITAQVRIPDPSLGATVVEELSLKEDVLRSHMTNNSTMERANIYIVVYDSDGKMTDLEVRTVSLIKGSSNEDLFRFAGETDVRLFWIQEETAVPLCQMVHCNELKETQ